MSKESLFLSVSALLAVGFVGASLVRNGTNASAADAQIPAPTPIKITAAQERDLLPSGVPQNKQVIIEFADYECPPCRQTYLQLHDVLAAHPDVTFVFHQFPLTRIHPLARRAAYLSEAARQQNKFAPMHDFLFTHGAQFSDAELTQFLQKETINASEVDTFVAQKGAAQIQKDKQLGEAVGVQGTPTLLLRDRDGSYKIVAISALPSLLRN